MNLKAHVPLKYIFLLLSFILFIYLIIRAILVPVGHDEAATFFYYVQTGNFLPFLYHYDANNHLLNSFLTWIAYYLLGPTPLTLRLANLLFAPVFFYFCYKLSTLLKDKFLQIAFFITLCLSHHFIEFFGLSRGYGMSMALLMGSLWLLARYASGLKMKDLLLCLVMTGLATLANLTLINTMILVIGMLFIFSLTANDNTKRKLSKLLAILIAGIGPLIFFTYLLLWLRSGGELYSGSSTGFWSSTVRSLLRLLFSADSAAGYSYFIFTTSVSSILMILALIRWKEQQVFIRPGALLYLLFAGNVIGTTAIALIFHVNYPEDRLGLYFYPLLTAAFIFLVDEESIHLKKVTQYILVLPLAIIPLHFMLNLNTTYAACSTEDNIPERFYNKVESGWTPGNLPPTIGSHRQGHFAWSWLVYRHGGNLSPEYWSEYPCSLTDFIIADKETMKMVRDEYDSIDYNNVSGNYLLKRKSPVEKILVYTKAGISTNGPISSDFFTLSEGPVDSLAGKSFYIGYDLRISSGEDPLMAWILTEVRDNDGKVLRYEGVALEWLRNKWSDKTSRFINSMIVYSLPAGSAKYITYLWNERKKPLEIAKGKVIIYQLN